MGPGLRGFGRNSLTALGTHVQRRNRVETVLLASESESPIVAWQAFGLQAPQCPGLWLCVCVSVSLCVCVCVLMGCRLIQGFIVHPTPQTAASSSSSLTGRGKRKSNNFPPFIRVCM